MVRFRLKPPGVDAVTLVVGSGDTTAHNMGGGIAVVDQADSDTSRLQRIVLAAADMEAILPATSMNLVLDGGAISVASMGCGVFVVDQVDQDTKRLQRVVLTKADLEAVLAWLG